MAKQLCLICKTKHPVDASGLLKMHATADRMLCRGSGTVPAIPKGVGKRRVHDDGPPRELDDDLTEI